MPVLQLSLSPQTTARLADVLTCWSKFGDTITLEARHDKISLTTLNLSKTSYASCTFDASTCFLLYAFTPANTSPDARFVCQVYNKALLSAVKTRDQDARGRDSSIDHCTIAIEEDAVSTSCRMLIKTIGRHGVTKTYKLTYQSVETMHAVFDKQVATRGWQISSRVLREYVEYFGARTEQLDMVTKGGKAVFTSFTEKVMNGKEVLKQPLETAISIHTDDFQHYRADEDMHIVISVRDFRAIVMHAETLHGSLEAHFSRPSRPLQFTYGVDGMTVEVTLMTTGSYQGTIPEPTPRSVVPIESVKPARHSAVSVSAAKTPSSMLSPVNERMNTMPPPNRPAEKASKPQLRPTSSLRERLVGPAQDDGPLFVSQDDNDKAWDPPDFENEAAEDELAWDANGDMTQQQQPMLRDASSRGGASGTDMLPDMQVMTQGIGPTQRLSQMHDMFDCLEECFSGYR